VRALHLTVPALVAVAMLAPAVAHANPLDDYASRNGKTVCAALDKAQNSGEIFRLALTVAHDGGFSLKDAANVIGRSAAASCPWNEPKMQQVGTTTSNQGPNQIVPPVSP
jgi:hypothetical protein